MIVAVSLKFILEPSLEGKIFDIFVQVQVCIVALALFDVLLSFNSPARWFLIHAFGNFVVVWFSISDTVRHNFQCAAVDFVSLPQSYVYMTLFGVPNLCLLCFSAIHDHESASGKLTHLKLKHETYSPPHHLSLHHLQCIGGDFDLHSTYMVPAIHIYHMICFHCTKDDYFHHFVFAGIICPLGFYFKAGPIQNAVGFFICGLPGGLDFVMLALVKYKMMFALTEKKFNARINVWLRSPGLLFCAFSIWVAAPRPVNAGLLLGALLVALNGQYYMQMVVGNTFVKTRSDGADPYNC